jgi:hypothetical protein
LIRILGPIKENNTQRIRYNNELFKLKRLQSAGHVKRMDGKRITKRILESSITRKRPMGKARKMG